MTTFWIDAQGNLIKATSDPNAAPPGAVTSTTVAPESGRQKWDGTKWLPAPAEVRDADLKDVWGVLKAKGLVTDGDLPADRTPPKGRAP
jgi:hypothetical protein